MERARFITGPAVYLLAPRRPKAIYLQRLAVLTVAPKLFDTLVSEISSAVGAADRSALLQGWIPAEGS